MVSKVAGRTGYKLSRRVPISNQGRIGQQGEKDGLRLSYAVPLTLRASNHSVHMATRLWETFTFLPRKALFGLLFPLVLFYFSRLVLFLPVSIAEWVLKVIIKVPDYCPFTLLYISNILIYKQNNNELENNAIYNNFVGYTTNSFFKVIMVQNVLP